MPSVESLAACLVAAWASLAVVTGVQTAAEQKAWLILYTHDVAEAPSQWGCTPGVLARLADEALGRGFKVVTVAEGARLVS